MSLLSTLKNGKATVEKTDREYLKDIHKKLIDLASDVEDLQPDPDKDTTKLEAEVLELKAQLKQRDEFIQSLLMNLITSKQPVAAAAPNTLQSYLEKKAGTLSVKELGKRLPG